MTEERPDDEILRALEEAEGWSPERRGEVEKLDSEIAQLAGSANSEAELSRLIEEGRPMRDWVIHITRKEVTHEAERARLVAARTRTSPVAPCPEYDVHSFWSAFEAFKAALAELQGVDGDDGIDARKAALAAFNGGPLPTELGEPGLSMVRRADEALAAVRTALSVPGPWGGTPGGKGSLETDLGCINSALREYECSVHATPTGPGSAPDG